MTNFTSFVPFYMYYIYKEIHNAITWTNVRISMFNLTTLKSSIKKNTQSCTSITLLALNEGIDFYSTKIFFYNMTKIASKDSIAMVN